MTPEIIYRYFPDLTENQKRQFTLLKKLYEDWNEKINLISRKDIHNLYGHHVLGSLAIAKLVNFRPGTEILDVGTGGGFPGIPLAIMFPQAQFHLIDSIGKKIRVVEDIIAQIGLENTTCEQVRAEELKTKYHFVVSRAALPMPQLVKATRKNISKTQINPIPNGVIALKGGTLDAEIRMFGSSVETIPVSKFFKDEYFVEKKIIYLPI